MINSSQTDCRECVLRRVMMKGYEWYEGRISDGAVRAINRVHYCSTAGPHALQVRVTDTAPHLIGEGDTRDTWHMQPIFHMLGSSRFSDMVHSKTYKRSFTYHVSTNLLQFIPNGISMNSPNIAGKCDGTHVKMVKLAKLHSCKKNRHSFNKAVKKQTVQFCPTWKIALHLEGNKGWTKNEFCNSFIVAMPSSPPPPMFSFNINSSRDFPV